MGDRRHKKKKLKDLQKQQKEMAKAKLDHFLHNLNSAKKFLHMDMDKAKSANKKKPVPVSSAWNRQRNAAASATLNPISTASNRDGVTDYLPKVYFLRVGMHDTIISILYTG